MSVDVVAIGNWAQVITAIVAIVTLPAIFLQIRRDGLRHSTDLILKLRDQYNDENMRRIRKAAAKALANNEGSYELLQIVNFFDRIGLLTHMGALDKRMVCNTFYDSICMYSSCVEDDIVKLREKGERNSAGFEELVYLHKEIYGVRERQSRRLRKNSTIAIPSNPDKFFTLKGWSHMKRPDRVRREEFLLAERQLGVDNQLERESKSQNNSFLRKLIGG